jgi:hypothetical protein
MRGLAKWESDEAAGSIRVVSTFCLGQMLPEAVSDKVPSSFDEAILKPYLG